MAVLELFQSGLPNFEKEARFLSLTGKSRRTYYNYKKRLGLNGERARIQALGSAMDSKHSDSNTDVAHFKSGGNIDRPQKSGRIEEDGLWYKARSLEEVVGDKPALRTSG